MDIDLDLDLDSWLGLRLELDLDSWLGLWTRTYLDLDLDCDNIIILCRILYSNWYFFSVWQWCVRWSVDCVDNVRITWDQMRQLWWPCAGDALVRHMNTPLTIILVTTDHITTGDTWPVAQWPGDTCQLITEVVLLEMWPPVSSAGVWVWVRAQLGSQSKLVSFIRFSSHWFSSGQTWENC